MKPQVLVFSDEVGRGKTTFLKKWLNDQKCRIGGILSPKIDGKRYFEFISSGELIPMETATSTIEIGKHRFDSENFRRAEEELWQDWINPEIDTVILDEVGPLEIKKKEGFHSFLMKIQGAEVVSPKRLILVVRDYCLQDFIRTYPFEEIKIVTEHDLVEVNLNRPIGIVLCGGRSERMQEDKGLLNYHSMPQWKYVYELLRPFCAEVYLSLNSEQEKAWNIHKTVPRIVDNKAFLNHGPITGLMSVFERLGSQPVFIVACDYPLLRMEHLLALAKARAHANDVVAYKNNDWPEPLISLFETSAVPKLKEYFSGDNDSVAKFIGSVKTEFIEVLNPDFLRNVNNRDQFEALKQELRDDKGDYHNSK